MRLAALTASLPGRRRKRAPRPDGPRTIVPPREEPARHDAPDPAARPPADPVAGIEAARERLRASIPPLGDDDAPRAARRTE